MLKSERQEMILEILQERKHITTQELAKKTFASYSSVRRDLEALENLGIINRSYGRVEIANRNSLLVSYPIRINKNSAQKSAIAKKAASLIKEGDTIFVDSSSSCSFFAKELFHMKGITVITNNVEVISFMSQSNIDLICSGGLQTLPNRYALVGPIAEETFRNIHADWVVFSARSLTKDGLIYDVHYNETALRKLMLENAEKKLFLCDSSKLGTNSTYYQCSLADIDYMVCDSKDAKHYQQMYPNLKIM
ncbi:MAG: DeoR/GlpR family DNA-binding transcription regulator [Clostridiales bacterium]|nr:DeoR/GlpR family DNA-binding transcription regulator [Clostridiales bacterium]